MDLEQELPAFLQHYLSDEYFGAKTENDVLFLECSRYKINAEVSGAEFWIRYLEVTDRGNKFGDQVVEALIAFCHQQNLVGFVLFPDPDYFKFWRRNGFEPEPLDDEKWFHEDWGI